MRILYLANLRLPTEKAYGIQIVKMCEAFANAGAETVLLTPRRRNPSGKDVFDYYGVKKSFRTKIIPMPDFYFRGNLDKLAVFLKTSISALALTAYGLMNSLDIIYSRDEFPVFLLSFFRKNLYFESHRFSQKRSVYYRRFKSAGVRIVTITQALKEEFMELGFDDKDVLVAPDGVDIKEFDINISKEDARRKVGLPVDKNIVLYAGHLFEWKGANVLLEAARNFQFPISNFQKSKENIIFVFVGGTEYDIGKFKQKAEGLDNVFILGHKPHKDIPLFMKGSDVLILPNLADSKISSYTSPLKLFEYMASKRPIVASDLPALREVINDKNSVLVRPQDPKLLAGAITNILANNKLGGELSEQAFIDVQDYTWDKRAAKILNFVTTPSI